MNDLNINALSRSLGVDKTYSAANQKHVKRAGDEPDTVQLSKVPDLSAVEAALEEEYSGLRSKLENDANSESYPPLETIDRLAAMFAINLNSNGRKTE